MDCGRPLFTEFNTRKGQRERRREDGQFIRPSPKIARKGSLVTAKVYTVTPPRLWVEVEGSLRASIVDLEAKNLGGGDVGHAHRDARMAIYPLPDPSPILLIVASFGACTYSSFLGS